MSNIILPNNEILSPGVESLLKQIRFKRAKELRGPVGTSGVFAPGRIPWCPFCGSRPVSKAFHVRCVTPGCPLQTVWATEDDWKSLSAKVWQYTTNLKKPATSIPSPDYKNGRLLLGFTKEEGIYDGSDVLLSEAFFLSPEPSKDLFAPASLPDLGATLIDSMLLDPMSPLNNTPRVRVSTEKAQGWKISMMQATTVVNSRAVGKGLGIAEPVVARPQLTEAEAWSKRVGLLFVN